MPVSASTWHAAGPASWTVIDVILPSASAGTEIPRGPTRRPLGRAGHSRHDVAPAAGSADRRPHRPGDRRAGRVRDAQAISDRGPDAGARAGTPRCGAPGALRPHAHADPDLPDVRRGPARSTRPLPAPASPPPGP